MKKTQSTIFLYVLILFSCVLYVSYSKKIKIQNKNYIPDFENKFISFQAAKIPDDYVAHNNFILRFTESEESDLFRQDASFIVRAALNKEVPYFSFESVNYPGYYIKHDKNNTLSIAKLVNTDDFKNNASFKFSFPNNGDTKHFSIESFDLPNYFFRLANTYCSLVHFSNDDAYKNDSSFSIVSGLWDLPDEARYKLFNKPISIKSFDIPNNYVRFRDDLTLWSESGNGELFNQQASFYVRKGLNGKDGNVSFESIMKPGFFIKQINDQLILSSKEKTDSFKDDASFRFYYSDVGNPNIISIESSKNLNYYIRHQDSKCKMSQKDNSKAFKNESSWAITPALMLE